MISTKNQNNFSRISAELNRRGFDAAALTKAAKSGNINNLLNLLSDDDKQKLSAALSDDALIKNLKDKYNG